MAVQGFKFPLKVREHQHRMLDSTVWNNFVYRDDDIIISSYSKSGTTWVQQIVAQLLWNGAENIDVCRRSPWLDNVYPSKKERLANVESQSHRRFIKTHLPADNLIMSPKARYIYLGRDGRDVVWSLYNHHANLKPEVIQGIDDNPERFGLPLGYAPESVTDYFNIWLSNNGYPWWPYWEHVLSWWRIRDLPNIMLVHFSELKRDMPATIRRIAAFLGIDIDESAWDGILDHCSFTYMKEHGDKCVPFNGDIWNGGSKTFLHKGVNGRWRDMLTQQDIVNYERVADEQLGAACAKWLSTGEFIDSACPERCGL